MAQLTIAQRRERQLEHFNDAYINDIDKAKKILNSYYRLCGLSERTFYLANDEKTCNGKYCKECEERELRWISRLNEMLNGTNLKVTYLGFLPSICEMNEETGAVKHQEIYCIAY